MVSVITFFISLAGIGGVFFLKHKELEKGEDLFPVWLLRLGEEVEQGAFFAGHLFLRLFKRETLRILLIPIRRFFVKLLISFQGTFNAYFSRLVNFIRGRGTLSSRGEASAFLKDIAEFKESQKEVIRNDAEKG